MEKANVTLYTVIGDSNRIVEAIRERFKEMNLFVKTKRST